MSNYRRIMYEDRCQIYALSKRGASQESIAEGLGVSQSAVCREMCRNRGQRGYRFKPSGSEGSGTPGDTEQAPQSDRAVAA
jgi:IS30 family transposase